eukprot:TRINITY_DN8973_c0_g1_i1.p1 TRINITY_DN8973_c0_g1~~TRINITY_DN8973_c0_g1_i1.p1  ORF type:complete len:173 (+),score=70.51 TRINITY_DN8973_c0_g1_i1:74-592(+)
MNWKNANISEVAKEQIWKEHVKNESHYMNSKESFSINPYNLHKTKPICESIAKRPKRFLGKEQALLASIQSQLGQSDAADTTLLEQVNSDINKSTLSPEETARREKTATDIKNCLLSVHKTPVDKYGAPMTESQEVGWLSRPLLQVDRQFNHSLKSCDITRFAGECQFGKAK